MSRRMLDFINRLFNEHLLVRRVLVFWALWLITLVVLRFVRLMDTLDAATVGGVGTIVGLLGTVLAFYIKNRQLDQGKDPTGE